LYRTPTWNGQISGPRRSETQDDSVVLVQQVLSGYVLADMDLGTELNTLRYHQVYATLYDLDRQLHDISNEERCGGCLKGGLKQSNNGGNSNIQIMERGRGGGYKVGNWNIQILEGVKIFK